MWRKRAFSLTPRFAQRKDYDSFSFEKRAKTAEEIINPLAEDYEEWQGIQIVELTQSSSNSNSSTTNANRPVRSTQGGSHRSVATVDESDEFHGRTPLHNCAREGDLTQAKFLITAGADIDARDKILQTPLHRACHWGHFDIVTLLISENADIYVFDSMGQLPEDIAFHQGHVEIYRYLLFCNFLLFLFFILLFFSVLFCLIISLNINQKKKKSKISTITRTTTN